MDVGRLLVWTTKANRGKLYHYDSRDRKYIRDEDGKMIPSEICLCYAREPSECCCGCTSWGDYSYDWDYDPEEPDAN